MKVQQFHSKNQFIIYGDDGSVTFRSYDSIIAVRKNRKITLGKNWDYSRTTNKYRNIFLGESKAETERKIKSGIYIVDESL